MGLIEVRSYSSAFFDDWNSLVSRAKNSVFLHNRDFMDYHADRFEDASLLFLQDGRLIAVLPANRSGETIFSHAGLTFGGMLYGPEVRAVDVESALAEAFKFYTNIGCRKMIYKPSPHFLHRAPSDEDIYFIFKFGGRLVRRDLSSVIDLSLQLPISNLRRRGWKKAISAGLVISDNVAYGDFHKLLKSVLSRHDAKPVHSVRELQILQERFPDRIRLLGAFLDGALLAGIWVFDFGEVVHTQYLAASPLGRELGALDFIIIDLISRSSEKKYISLGVSTEQSGKFLNMGLINQKEGFGARGVILDSYEVDLRMENGNFQDE